MRASKSIQHSRKSKSKSKSNRKNKNKSYKHMKTTLKKKRRLSGGELDEESNLGKKRERKEVMPQLSIGRNSAGQFVSNIKFAPEKELKNLVNNQINYGPQIVSIPVPPWRHAFLVDVEQGKKRILISDWGGSINKTAGIVGSADYTPGWEQYSELMIKLEQKYGWPIEYFPIDDELFKFSLEHNNTCSGGGCSHYIYAWVKKYYPDYSLGRN
jgi:hypothetical protein